MTRKGLEALFKKMLKEQEEITKQVPCEGKSLLSVMIEACAAVMVLTVIGIF